MGGAFDPLAFDFGAFDAELPAPNAYARMMTALLPPGKVWRLIGESFLSKLFAACADELGRLEDRAANLLEEADPSTAVELLPEYEAELNLASTGTDAERQARIVARRIARQRFRPVDFKNALAPLLGINATLDTTTMTGGGVPTGSGPWEAIVTFDTTAAGNKLDVVLTGAGAAEVIEVRDGQRYDDATSSWIVEVGTVGCAYFKANVGSLTAADLEAAINASSALCQVTTPDPWGDFFDYPGTPTRSVGTSSPGVVVLERTHAYAVSVNDDREIYRFFIYRDPSLPGTYYLASAQALVDDIKPSHTVGYVIESVNFKCDDPFSLCDRDILGA